MEVALAQKDFLQKVKDKYGYENRIVGLVFAKYTNSYVQELVRQNYNIWDKDSGVAVDFFWAGYGRYFSDKETKKRIKVDTGYVNKGVYYDEDAFLSFKNNYSAFKNLTYSRISVVFIDYEKGELKLDNAICFQFSKNVEVNLYAEIMEKLIAISKNAKSFGEFRRDLLKYRAECKLNDISISDIVTTAGTVASFLIK